MRSLRLSVVAVVFALSCGGNASPPGALSSRWAAPSILAHIPADTPYLVAVLEPMNEALRQRMMQGFDERMLQTLRTLDQAPGFASTGSPRWIRALMALANEIHSKDAARWAEDLGFAPRGRFALYGLSAWPVMRIDVSDAARLRSVIERVLGAAGVQPQQRVFEGRRYWLAGNAEVSFIAAVFDREAVAALVPTGSLTTALPLVIGTRMPEHSLAASTAVPDMLARHHMVGLMLGYLDTHKLVEIVAGATPGPFDAPIRAATGPVPPACRADLDRLAAIAPRLVLGYHRLDNAGLDVAMVVETAPGVAGGLRKLHTTVPGVTAPVTGHPLFALGAALDPGELVGWLRGVTRQLRDRPFTCPWFRGINEAGSELAAKLDGPLPPTWLGVRGFSLVLDSASISPPSFTGHVVVTGDRVADLVSSLAGTVPAIAGIPLARDGRPIALPIQQLQLPVQSAHLALTTDRLVIAAGPDSARRATEQLAAPTPPRSPLAMMAFDVQRLQRVVASLGPSLNTVSYLRDLGMSLDVVDDGISFELWGSWAPTSRPAPAGKVKP